jgi:effector-binding domain-containing protein
MHHLPVLVAIAIAPQAAEKLPEAEALLTKVEAKLGSSQIRTAPAAIVMTGGMEIPGMARIPHEQLFVGVDRVKYSSNMGDFGTQTQGTTPEYAWSTDPATGITIKTGMDRLGVARGYAVERRAPWTSLYSAAKTLGVTDLDGRKHFELEMTPHDGGAPDRWFIDGESLLPTGFATVLPDPQGGAIAVTFVFSDWKDAGGVLFPYRKSMRVGDIALDFVFDSIQMTATNDEAGARVAPPENVLAAWKDPSQRATQAGAHGACSIETIAAKKALAVRLTIPEAEVSKYLGIMYQEVMAYAMKQKLTPTAPPFARFHSHRDGKIDLEGGMTFSGDAPGEGRVQATTLPGGRAAMTWHVGPYHDLEKTCRLLESWMKEQGLKEAGGLWEIFWTDPGIEPDATKWRTQIYWPIAD